MSSWRDTYLSAGITTFYWQSRRFPNPGPRAMIC